MFDLGKAGELYTTLSLSPNAANRVKNFSVTCLAYFARDGDKGIEPVCLFGRTGKSVFVGREVRGAIAWQGVLRRDFAPKKKLKHEKFQQQQNFHATVFVILTRGDERNSGCAFWQWKPAQQILNLRPSRSAASSVKGIRKPRQ